MAERDTAVDPDRLSRRLPDPPEQWERSDGNGGTIEYRIAGEEEVCAIAKLTVRPDIIGDSAIRLDRKQGCQKVGTDRFENIGAVVETVSSELEALDPD